MIPIYRMNLKLGTCRGVCNTPLPVQTKNLIPIYRINQKSDTCWDMCNTPLPIRNKYLINTYLLNPILGKDWILRIMACCIRSTNAHNYGQMIDPPNTFRGICNTSLPIRDKCLTNKYLLNHIPGKDWIVHVGAYAIRPTNAHDHGQMIDPPDTCRGVCNTPLSIPDKYLINMYLLDLIPAKDWIVHVGACAIRPTNAHDYGLMMDPLDTCWGVCNTPLPIRIKNLIPIYWMYLKLGRFLGVCLCDQLHLGGKPLKFVWEHVKPAEDRMGVTNATQTSTSNP